MVRAISDPAAPRASAKHPAFEKRALTGYDVSTWQMRENLNNWDATFALGFTSYQALLTFLKSNQASPVDESRELLIRLYMLEPSFPAHFRPPNMQDLVDFLFGLETHDAVYAAERRKKCASLLAKLLGKESRVGIPLVASCRECGEFGRYPDQTLVRKGVLHESRHGSC